MTLLTVIFVLGPMYEDGNGWYIMLCTSSMLYHHLLNPLAAILSFTVLWCIAILGMDFFTPGCSGRETAGRRNSKEKQHPKVLTPAVKNENQKIRRFSGSQNL